MYKINLATWNKKKQAFSVEKVHTIKRAIGKIRLTQYFVYENELVLKELIKIRRKFDIPDNFYEEFHVECTTEFIAELLAQTMLKWKKEAKIKSKNTDEKFKSSVYENKNLDSYNPKYINDRLWSFFVWSKLFEIPQDKVINCISNLLDYHFPTVNSGLQIQVYPSTTEEELKFIWDDVQRIQKITIKNLLTRPKFEYQMHDADKKAYELKQTTKMKNKNIAEKIVGLKLLPKNNTTYTYVEVGKSLRRYKKFIRRIYS